MKGDDVPESKPEMNGGQKRSSDSTINSNESLPSKKQKSKRKGDPDVLAFRRVVQECCATNNLMRAMEEYEKVCASGTKIEAQSFYNMINLCDGLGNRVLHVGTPKPSDDQNGEKKFFSNDAVCLEDRLKYATKVHDHMKSLNIALTETAFSGMVKLHSKMNNTEEAEALLIEAESVQQCKPKLRLYASLLATYCMDGRLLEAIRIWSRLSSKGLVLTEREYMYLMKGSTKVGNAFVFERVLSDLAEDVLVPSSETSEAIVSWFQSTHSSTATPPPTYQNEIQELLQKIQPYDEAAAAMGPVVREPLWKIHRGVAVDVKSGKLLSACLEGLRLRPIELSNSLWKVMQGMNEKIAKTGKLDGDTSGVQGGRKGPKRTILNAEERQRQWNQFDNFLTHSLARRKIDVVIDGANVGYFEKNFVDASNHVDYDQIDWVIRHFQRMNKSVLLVMHSRHFSRHLMPRKFEPLVRQWKQQILLYMTPRDMNDDWFWMHAALLSGPGTLVVTNDEMRDHHFQMLAPRSFLRWKDRHQVHFCFGEWTRRFRCKSREVQLTYPDPYSRRIQRVDNVLVVPLPKKGDENRFLDGSFVADDEHIPDEETYLCIKPS